MMPAAPVDRARVHMFDKLIDEYLHHSCMILTFSTAFRPRFLTMAPQERDAEFFKSPIPRRAEHKRDVVNNGLDSPYVRRRWRITRSSSRGWKRRSRAARI